MKKSNLKPFAFDLDEKDIKRERSKARELRESQWWKRCLAKGICYYCGKQTPPKELTMDHIVPISRGGRSTSLLKAIFAPVPNMPAPQGYSEFPGRVCP